MPLTSDQSSSSTSLYFSPPSSLDNLSTMVHPQSTDGIEETALLHRINRSYLELQSSLNVTFDHPNICTRLTNDHPHSENGSHSTNALDTDRMARREKKIHERWFNSSSSTSAESSTKKAFLGVDFPPIAVLRRKFSSKSNENNTTDEQVRRSNVFHLSISIFFPFSSSSSSSIIRKRDLP